MQQLAIFFFLAIFKGFVYYKSVLVNVENLKDQVTRNEIARLKTEEKLTELKAELGNE